MSSLALEDIPPVANSGDVALHFVRTRTGFARSRRCRFFALARKRRDKMSIGRVTYGPTAISFTTSSTPNMYQASFSAMRRWSSLGK